MISFEYFEQVVSSCGAELGVDDLRVGRYTDPQGNDVDAWFVQHFYRRVDSVTGLTEFGYGRKWHVSPHATESEIVLTCLKAMLTNAEHEVREKFTYLGEHIFQPHQNVAALLEACQHSDARPVPVDADDIQRGAILG